jgi:hypothetical protein
MSITSLFPLDFHPARLFLVSLLSTSMSQLKRILCQCRFDLLQGSIWNLVASIAPRRVRNQRGLLIILIQYAEPRSKKPAPLTGHERRHPTILLCHPASLAIAARLQVGSNMISNSAGILKARNLII